jgi:hypothetical protein
MIMIAGRVKRIPVIWSLKACFLKALELLVEMSVLLVSIAPQYLSICRMFMTALANIPFYLKNQQAKKRL